MYAVCVVHCNFDSETGDPSAVVVRALFPLHIPVQCVVFAACLVVAVVCCWDQLLWCLAAASCLLVAGHRRRPYHHLRMQRLRVNA